jgi:hypothetical protein
VTVFYDLSASLAHDTIKNGHFMPVFNVHGSKIILENSDTLVYYSNEGTMFAFSLLKQRNKNLEILLLGADIHFAKRMIHDLYKYAFRKKFRSIRAAPRIDYLRNIYNRYGFEIFCGVKGMNEFVEKTVLLPKYSKVNHTMKFHKEINYEGPTEYDTEPFIPSNVPFL